MNKQQPTHVTASTIARIRQAGTDRMKVRGASLRRHQANVRRRVYIEYALNALAFTGLCAALYVLFFFAWFLAG